jgi:DNA-binding Lrp family transcriptional regulator
MNESNFKTLRELSKGSALSQRELSRKIGLSVGRVNNIINALLEKSIWRQNVSRIEKQEHLYVYPDS